MRSESSHRAPARRADCAHLEQFGARRLDQGSATSCGGSPSAAAMASMRSRGSANAIRPRNWRRDPSRSGCEKAAYSRGVSSACTSRRRPHVELALMAFGVGVQARVKAAVPASACRAAPNRRSHAATRREQRLAGGECGARILAQQLAVVVQHFLEVRNHPVAIHRIAGEAAAQLVV